MVTSSELRVGVQDDDILWTEYLKVASDADDRLVKDFTKVIDNVLVFVALFSAVLTAFIIQTSANLQPQPAEVTNKILIAIYHHTINASTTPIDFEQFFRLDDATKSRNDLHSWLLYISLALSILVAALAMVTKWWLDRYSREVTMLGSESPRARAMRRQEVYDGLVAWKMEKCIDAIPVMALIALFLFAIFIHSSVSVDRRFLGFFVGAIFFIGISFLSVASFSAAFLDDAPFRSPFSDFVNVIFRIFGNKPDPGFRPVWGTIAIVLSSVLMLVAGGYLILKQNYTYFLCIYYAVASVFALMRKGKETDMPPRRLSLPTLVLFSFIAILAFFLGSSFAAQVSKVPRSIDLFVESSLLLGFLGYIAIKISETRPMTVEAKAVSWFLNTSSNKDPNWFQKAVQIAEKSPNVRPLLVRKLLPLLIPPITCLPKNSGDGGITSEQEGCINTLAILMDFAPNRQPPWRYPRRNEALLERPTLPQELIDRLETLHASVEKCSHTEGDNQEKWHDGTLRCPKACVGNAVEHILQLHKLDKEYRQRRWTACFYSLMTKATNLFKPKNTQTSLSISDEEICWATE